MGTERADVEKQVGIFYDGLTGETIVRELTPEEIEANKPAEPGKQIPVFD